MSADDIGRGGRGTAIRVTRCPESSPRSYASACLADFVNSANVSSVMCWLLVFFLLILRKQKYQMDSSCVRQIKIDVSQTPALPSARLRIGDSAFPRAMQPSHNRPPLR